MLLFSSIESRLRIPVIAVRYPGDVVRSSRAGSFLFPVLTRTIGLRPFLH